METRNSVLDNHYLDSRLASIYDLDSPWSIDRDFYLSLAEKPNQTILDLGCGTGLLSDAYAAKEHTVTGADPSPAMLEVAKRKPHGKEIEWVQCFAQEFKSNKLFDLIVMTGHAFQVLLDDADILASFKAMRKHVKPDGRIVFESRNPNVKWSDRWNYDIDIELPDGRTVQESRRFIEMKNDRMTFELHYRFDDQSLVSGSELRFASKNSIEELLRRADLRVESLFGDWDCKPFDQTDSDEMIYIVRPM
jgi:ubiquinone/menaquinone biosynthesis C-methylase UbiE